MSATSNAETRTIAVNDDALEVTVSPDTPLLWLLRHGADLPGTRFGCGMALCGACTVHVNGQAVRACVTPVSAITTQRVTTIEGINGPIIDALRTAWRTLDVSQCGYCQSGQLMSAAALLATTKSPTDEQIDTSMDGNICRCGTYPRIRAAIHAAAKALRAINDNDQ